MLQTQTINNNKKAIEVSYNVISLTLLNFITQNVLVTIFENMQNYLVQF